MCRLQIEVFLPSKERAAGILQHYNLHYNIALVRVNDYSPSHPIKIQHRRCDNREVLAVGRIFKSGELMASRGHKASMACEHDCGYLLFSKCRITKVCVLSSRIITQLKIMVVLEYELMTISV